MNRWRMINELNWERSREWSEMVHLGWDYKLKEKKKRKKKRLKGCFYELKKWSSKFETLSYHFMRYSKVYLCVWGDLVRNGDERSQIIEIQLYPDLNHRTFYRDSLMRFFVSIVCSTEDDHLDSKKLKTVWTSEISVNIIMQCIKLILSIKIIIL